MTGQNNDSQWYIAREGKQHGPLTDIEMRTFVAHSYLRPADLIWRAGMPDWLPAPTVFPAVFQQPAPGPQSPAPQAPSSPQPQSARPSPQAHGSDFDAVAGEESASPRPRAKRLMLAAVLVTLIGGGALALTMYGQPLSKMFPKSTGTAAISKSESSQKSTETAKAADDGRAAATPQPSVAEAPASTATVSIDGSLIDARLQKIPVWGLIKKEYPDWYISNVAAADKLASEKKPEAEIAAQLAQGLSTLRRQNADKALAASPDQLKRMASAFLENLKALRAMSIGACYGFISKGETSPAVVELLQTPENAVAFNTQAAAIFEAAIQGGKTPAKHEPAVKGDYELLIKELGKLGWKDEDLQVFSNPRLLAKREPSQVCQMVQDWFVAHLAINDQGAQDRLLFETLKPVVQG